MGAWGAKLYQDDVAQDVRDQFNDLLCRGKTAEEITRQLISSYNGVIDDPDDGPIFWFALADTQWNLGRLLPEVKEKALAWLDNGSNLKRWQEENPKLVVTREQVLRELREKLNSPPPPEKKNSQYRLYKCEWNIWDVFAYQLESDLAKEKGLYGRYFLIQKGDEGIWHPGHIVPIVRVKLTADEKLPTCTEEFDQLEYIQTARRRFEQLELETEPELDEYGFLPQFEIELLNTSKKSIPKKLVFVGNFTNAAPPPKEFVPQIKISTRTIAWEKFGETFESLLIKSYCDFNLACRLQ